MGEARLCASSEVLSNGQHEKATVAAILLLRCGGVPAMCYDSVPKRHQLHSHAELGAVPSLETRAVIMSIRQHLMPGTAAAHAHQPCLSTEWSDSECFQGSKLVAEPWSPDGPLLSARHNTQPGSRLAHDPGPDGLHQADWWWQRLRCNTQPRAL